MKLRALLLASIVWIPLAQGGCGEDPPKAYPSYQVCFDDHIEVELLTATTALVSCCMDHPIGGLKPVCGTDAPACINYVTANLDQTDANTIEVMEACQEYEVALHMPPSE